MFWFWLKPKGRKKDNHLDEARYGGYGISFNELIKLANMFCAICWFVAMPFLFIAFSETIKPFVMITMTQVILGFIAKVTDPDYYYF